LEMLQKQRNMNRNQFYIFKIVVFPINYCFMHSQFLFSVKAWHAISLIPFALALIPAAVQAQAVPESATELKAVTVMEEAVSEHLAPDLPSTTVSKTAEQLRERSIYSPDDAAALMPSITIRKRWLGDRNAFMGGRSYQVFQAGRSLVYVDGYLISNFLSNAAPRWHMVNMEALERVDAVYGPFSAVYPGNSIGTTLVMTERKPKGFEASASARYNHQDYKEYSTDAGFANKQLSTRLASRLDSGLWYTLGVQRTDSHGQPSTFSNAVGSALGTPDKGTRVTGTHHDIDQQNRRRVLYGERGLEHTVQDSLNLRLGYDLSSTQEIEGRISLWRNDSNAHSDTWLRDANGNRVWSGTVNDGVNSFVIPANNFSPSMEDDLHRQLGLTWKTRHATGWNASVVLSHYEMLHAISRQSRQAQPLAEAGGPGTVTRKDGTGWHTIDVQTTYKPTAGDFGNGRHALVFGLHRSNYKLESNVWQADDWRHSQNDQSQHHQGKTTITALYAQDTWTIAPQWALTSGLRLESFEGKDGAQYFAGSPAVEHSFPKRRIRAGSPKLSLAWTPADDLLLRASFGRGVRFPSVDDLFNGTRTGTSITTADPNLRPEVSRAFELSAEKYWGVHMTRASLFRDDIRDTILRQTDHTVFPQVTRNSNVDRTLTQGLELVWQLQDLFTRGFNLGGSATWSKAEVKANAPDPALVGKQWPRIPRQRYSLEASYRPNAQWLFGANWRWHRRSFAQAMNTDTNSNVYGGISAVNELGVKAAWKFAPNWEWGLGVNNLNNHKTYQSHPLPRRSVQMELRYAMQ